MLDPSYAKNNIPIIASVSEHQVAFFYFLDYLFLFGLQKATRKNENFFELFKDGKPYLSLYHDCKVTRAEFSEGNSFNVYLEKVHDSGYGPELGSRISLSFEAAGVKSVNINQDGNFEDVDEIVYLDDAEETIEIKLVVSGVEFGINCSRVVLDLVK